MSLCCLAVNFGDVSGGNIGDDDCDNDDSSEIAKRLAKRTC